MTGQMHLEIPSRLLGRNVPCRVFRPDGAGSRWCLLLHGFGGTEQSWQSETPAEELAAHFGLNLVMPGCGDGYYENTREPMLDFLGRELPAFLAREFGFSQNPRDISVAGISMGGFGALLLSGSYPRVYGKCASFSGAFILEDVVVWNQRVLGNADYLYLCRVFGDFDTLLGSERDPEAVAKKALSQGELGKLWLLCGEDDKRLITANRKLAENLKKAGADIRFTALSGGHDGRCWNPAMEPVFRWLAET